MGETWTEFRSLQTLPTTKGWHGPNVPHISRMKSLDVSPAAPETIFGAIEEGWCVVTRDGGASWEQIDTVDHDGHMIRIMSDNPNVIITTTGKGMFRSTDGGHTWAEANEGLEGNVYTPSHLLTDPRDANVLVTAVTGMGPGGFMRGEGPGVSFARSENQGATWDLLPAKIPGKSNLVPRGLASDPEAPDTLFAGMIDGSVWQSDDGGESFRSVIEGLPQVQSILVLHR
jgi:photosystem II stability/assembly factor-like uncharacterized protein